MIKPTLRKSKYRIIVLGYIVRCPLGGLTWHHLQYVMGLNQLGHDVYFLEDSDDYESCYNPQKHLTSADPEFGLAYTQKVFEKVGLSNRWAFYDAHTNSWRGPVADNVELLCKTADIMINVSEVNPIRSWFQSIPVRIMIDTDPGFNQIRHLTDPKMNETAKLHNHFFSFGENLFKDDCYIPDDGFHWKATRQPIVMDAWQNTIGPQNGRFTTVMQWDSYPAVQYKEYKYGLKSLTFQEYLDLPQKTDEVLELALGSKSAPRVLLQEKGWKINDPLKITQDPWTYQEYIKNSKAEFSIAKHGYVVSNSGWFSERSAAYLASGRPALVQETGFSNFMPAGEGLLSFRTPQEALEGIQKINKEYKQHCTNARKIAAEFFEAKKVLKALLNQIS